MFSLFFISLAFETEFRTTTTALVCQDGKCVANTVEDPLVQRQGFRTGKGQIEKLERSAEEYGRLAVSLAALPGHVADLGESTAGSLCVSLDGLHHFPGTFSVLGIASQTPQYKVGFGKVRPNWVKKKGGGLPGKLRNTAQVPYVNR